MQSIQLTLTLDEINTVLEGLGRLPYAQVYALIARIHDQATQQLQVEPRPSASPIELRERQSREM